MQHAQLNEAALLRRYRRILWVALVANVAMFAIEILAGWQGQSLSLLADAVDFLGDAVNYGASLLAFSFGALWRSRTALGKGIAMSGYGLAILGEAFWYVTHGSSPHATLMGVVSILALGVNLLVALLLYEHRNGDADMRAVWLCSRNDAIGNLGVLAAALAVYATGRAWPDLAVAAGIALLALASGSSVIRHSLRELSNV